MKEQIKIFREKVGNKQKCLMLSMGHLEIKSMCGVNIYESGFDLLMHIEINNSEYEMARQNGVTKNIKFENNWPINILMEFWDRAGEVEKGIISLKSKLKAIAGEK